MTLLETFVKNQTKEKESHPEIKPGAVIRIHQKFVEVLTQTKSKKQAKAKEADKVKERIQVYEGIVISRHGKSAHSTITVRKISDGIGAEYILPLDLPSIKKIEVVKQNKVRRAKLYYLRDKAGKAARFKDIKDVALTAKPKVKKEIAK
ncbi:MAG: 50S ribosomal protein L19 [bacterium]|nr:50S ribosomal protein L19 [bacterium]